MVLGGIAGAKVAEHFGECHPEEFHLWSPGSVVP